MIGRRVTVGLSLLCALVFCVLAAPAAMAVPSGTAFYTCEFISGTGTFGDGHCLSAEANGDWKLSKNAIAGTTTIALSNKTTMGEVDETSFSHLVGESGGTKFDLEAASFISSEGSWIENTEVGEAMTGIGEGEGRFIGVKVFNLPKCGVKDVNTKGGEEVILFNTVAKTTGMEVEVKPKSGTVFAEFEFIELQKPCPLKGVQINVEGSVKGTAEGPFLSFAKAGTEGNKELCVEKSEGPGLCAGKKKAYFEGTFTAKMGEEGGSEPTSISLTTTS